MHYSVSVISKSESYELMLNPYEEKTVPVYVKETKAQFVRSCRERLMRSVDYRRYHENPEGYESQNTGDMSLIRYLESVSRQLAMSDEELYEYLIAPYRERGIVDKKGNIVSTYNPNSKWNYWEEGGKWDGKLLVNQSICDREKYIDTGKIGPYGYVWVNHAKIKYIEWDEMRKYKMERLIPYSEYVVPKPFVDITYLKKLYPEDKYERLKTTFSTYAILNSDGWQEAGTPGSTTEADAEREVEWNLSFFDRFIKNANPEHYITVIDCNI